MISKNQYIFYTKSCIFESLLNDKHKPNQHW